MLQKSKEKCLFREMLQKLSTAKVYSGKKNRFFHKFTLIEETFESEPKCKKLFWGHFWLPQRDKEHRSIEVNQVVPNNKKKKNVNSNQPKCKDIRISQSVKTFESAKV